MSRCGKTMSCFFIIPIMQKIEIICVETEAFYELLEEVIKYFKEKEPKTEDEWISPSEAMKMLRIKSRGTLQKLRDEGRVRFTQPEKRIILYDRNSIRNLLDDFVYEPFNLPPAKKKL